MATVWLFFFLLDFFFGLYGTEPAEVDTWQRRLVEPPWVVIAITFIICAYIIPVPMWMFRAVRRNFFWMFVTTILVNVGMWLERYMVVGARP